jgi:hypothetical protein
MSLNGGLALITAVVIVVACVMWWLFRATTVAKDDDQSQRTVMCKNCRKAIVIAGLTKQVTEFSVKCDHCGKRSICLPEEINVTVRK